MQPLLFSAPRGKISYVDVNGNPATLAVALDISVSRTYSQQQTGVIGAVNMVSTDPTGIDVSVGISTVIPMNQSGDATKPLDFSPQGLGLAPLLQNILTSQAVSVSLFDQNTSKVIATIQECRITTDSTGASAQSVATRRYNFVGIFDAGYDNANATSALGYGDLT